MKRLPTIAVVVLLLLAGTVGTAAAGALITSARIKDDTVAGIDVRDRSLTGSDVQDRSLTLDDFVALPQGPKGDVGPTGAPGTNGLPGVVQRVVTQTLAPGQRRRWSSQCEEGEMAISGGVAANRPNSLVIEESFPNGFHWTATVRSTSTVFVDAYLYALCAPV